MPIAAVPEYLDREGLSESSPGMRFGMYLSIWTSRLDQEKEVKEFAGRKSPEAHELCEILKSMGMNAAIAHMQRRKSFPRLWEKNDHGAKKAWKRTASLARADIERVEALIKRQCALVSWLVNSAGQVFTLDAKSIAPFTTGLGNEHPLENGFAFLWPYGLPYLPGSGVKGVLRQAARELAGLVDDAQWDIASEWTEEAIKALFGSEDSNHAQRGALQFWDVIPQIKGNRLMVEIMTPHQKDYYQDGKTPHDSGQPNPISFLTVPPGSGFTFHVLCDVPFLRGLAPELAENGYWKRLLQQAFGHAFKWLGFGAKTAVGYGAMEHDPEAEERRMRERAAREEAARREREEIERKAQLEQAVAGLPEDAAWLERKRREGAWPDNNTFLDAIESFLDERETLSSEALDRLVEEMNKRWKGIMENPDATQGKKKKPKYKPRPRELATRLNRLREG